MYMPELTDQSAATKPKVYNFFENLPQVFVMYYEEYYTVETLCDNSLMMAIVDRLGEGIEIITMNCNLRSL
jgi:hypothetical protein